MFLKKSQICFNGVTRLGNAVNSQFIQNVSEEDRRNKILEDVFMRSTAENPYHKEIESNIMLCKALKEEKEMEFTYKKRSLVQRQNNVELRDLETMLRAGYVSKEIAAQNFENQALVNESRYNKHNRNTVLKKSRLRGNQYFKKLVEDNRHKKDTFKQDLLEQMEITKQKQHKAKLCILRDKEMMDEAVKKYREDMLQEERRAFEKKNLYRIQMEEFEQVQEQWRLKQNSDLQKAENAVAGSEKLAEIRDIAVKKAKRERLEAKDKISKKIGDRNYVIKLEKAKELDQLTELLIDEREAKDGLKFIQDQKRKLRERLTVRRDLNYLREDKKRQMLDEKKLEQDFYQEELRNLAERDKIQKILDEKKRMRTLEHRKALLNALDEKTRFKAKEMKRCIAVNTFKINEEANKAQHIAQYRTELLNQQDPDILRFLPRRLLRQKNI